MNPTNSINPISCSEPPEFFRRSTNGLITMPREMIAALYKSQPTQVHFDIGSPAFLLLRPQALTSTSGRLTPDSSTAPGYCPQRTAEFIEKVLEDHPCISRVYVPTVYLTKKLADTNKVVFQKFEPNDRWGIELRGGPQCSPR